MVRLFVFRSIAKVLFGRSLDISHLLQRTVLRSPYTLTDQRVEDVSRDDSFGFPGKESDRYGLDAPRRILFFVLGRDGSECFLAARMFLYFEFEKCSQEILFQGRKRVCSEMFYIELCMTCQWSDHGVPLEILEVKNTFVKPDDPNNIEGCAT